MQKVFESISDAGHGWVKVPFDVLEKLGMDCSDFTCFSYLYYQPKRGAFANFIYLEEDCDATKFVLRYRQVTGEDPKYRDRYCQYARLRTGRNYYPNQPDYKQHIRHAIAAERG